MLAISLLPPPSIPLSPSLSLPLFFLNHSPSLSLSLFLSMSPSLLEKKKSFCHISRLHDFLLKHGGVTTTRVADPSTGVGGPVRRHKSSQLCLVYGDIFYHSNQKTNAETEAVANVTPVTFLDSRGNNKANDWQAPGRTSGWP